MRGFRNEVTPADVVFVGSDMASLAPRCGRLRFARERQSERGRDTFRNRILELQRTGGLRIELFGPEHGIATHRDQLDADSQHVAGAARPAADDRID